MRKIVMYLWLLMDYSYTHKKSSFPTCRYMFIAILMFRWNISFNRIWIF